jgi:uncharacterized membrane protein (UPF0127 family)
MHAKSHLIRTLRFALSTTFFLTGCSQAASVKTTPPQLPTKPYKVCGQALTLEIAQTSPDRGKGLMDRDGLLPAHGMLFIFAAPEPLSFWMKNVRMDLDIAFFDEKGQLLNTHTMAAESPMVLQEKLKLYPSQGLALYAVEVEAGWYAKQRSLKTCRLEPVPGPSAQ